MMAMIVMSGIAHSIMIIVVVCVRAVVISSLWLFALVLSFLVALCYVILGMSVMRVSLLLLQVIIIVLVSLRFLVIVMGLCLLVVYRIMRMVLGIGCSCAFAYPCLCDCYYCDCCV